jgi:hypothetical protein
MTKKIFERMRNEWRNYRKSEKIAVGFLATTLAITGPSLWWPIISGRLEKKQVPILRDNQQIVYHPINSGSGGGMSRKNYTILTDIDSDGDWDLAERVYEGVRGEEEVRKLYFKRGHGPAQSINCEVEFVEPEFFDPFNGKSVREKSWPPKPMFIGPSTNTKTGVKQYIINGKVHKYNSDGKLIETIEID